MPAKGLGRHTYHQQIQHPDAHPEATPENVYYRHQHVSRRVPVQPRDELSQPAPEGDEREECRRRVRPAPPAGDPRRRDPRRAGETGQTKRGGRRDGSEEDGHVGVLLEHVVELLLVVRSESHVDRMELLTYLHNEKFEAGRVARVDFMSGRTRISKRRDEIGSPPRGIAMIYEAIHRALDVAYIMRRVMNRTTFRLLGNGFPSPRSVLKNRSPAAVVVAAVQADVKEAIWANARP